MADETTVVEEKNPLDIMFDNGVSPDVGKEKSPSAGQDAGTKPVEEGKENGEPAEAQAPVVSDEDLEKALDPQESPDVKMARLERDLGASSKEARRVVNERKEIDNALAEQGLKLVVKDGKVDLVPTEKYSADGQPFEAKISLKEITVADREALESGDIDEIQKVFDKMAARLAEEATRKLVKPAPTRDKEAPTISEERKASAFDHLAQAKDEFDMPKHENFEMNRKHIESFINHPARPQALKDAFAAEPELIGELVNSHINGIRAGVLKRAEAQKKADEKKAQEAQGKAEAGITDEGTVTAGSAGGSFLDNVGRSRFG